LCVFINSRTVGQSDGIVGASSFNEMTKPSVT
jgi:hypothetical protein